MPIVSHNGSGKDINYTDNVSLAWNNITVVLSAADKTFGDTLDISHGASTSGCISTCDEGKTWHIDSVTIAKDYFYSDNSTKECPS